VILGRVVGDVVSVAKHPHAEGRKMQLVQPITPDGRDQGQPLIALDTVSAADGDVVIVVDEGNGAAQILRRERGAIRSVIAGVVDRVDVGT
jgi:microcompartment protein CcmK/EutM